VSVLTSNRRAFPDNEERLHRSRTPDAERGVLLIVELLNQFSEQSSQKLISP